MTAPTAPGPGSPFWQFSLAFYARPGVAPACLVLQDEAGVDVNVLLYLLFLADGGWCVDAHALDRIETAAGRWRDEVVRPLRGVRRALKADLGAITAADAAALRSEVKRIELESERLQQEALHEGLPPAALAAARAARVEAARANVAVYAERLGGLPQAEVSVLLDALGTGGR